MTSSVLSGHLNSQSTFGTSIIATAQVTIEHPNTEGCKATVHSHLHLTGPHAFGPKKIYFGHKILMKQPHDCSY